MEIDKALALCDNNNINKNAKYISECRYYPKFGRAEYEEVIQRHKIIAYTLREIIQDSLFITLISLTLKSSLYLLSVERTRFVIGKDLLSF